MTKKSNKGNGGVQAPPPWWSPPTATAIEEGWLPREFEADRGMFDFGGAEIDELVAMAPQEPGGLVIEDDGGDEPGYLYLARIPKSMFLKYLFGLFAHWLTPYDCLHRSELAEVLEAAFRQWGQFYYTRQGKIPIDPPSHLMRKFIDGWRPMIRTEHEQPGVEGDSPPGMEPES